MGDTADFLKAVQLAMRLEGIPEESIEHVINRLLYGDPRGLSAGHQAGEQSQIHVNLTTPCAPQALAAPLDRQIKASGRKL